MIFRRAICLMLACQLLLMQGLLCRGCPLSGGRHGHAAGRPHIHTRQFLPATQASAPQPNRCPCCQRRQAALAKDHLARAVSQLRAASQEKGEGDDAFYLPCDPQVVSGSRHQPKAESASLDLPVSFLPADLVRLDEGRRLAALPPPCSGLRPPPLYLLNLALLI